MLSTHEKKQKKGIGVIAQEVEEIVPELVTVENLKSDINPDALEDMHYEVWQYCWFTY